MVNQNSLRLLFVFAVCLLCSLPVALSLSLFLSECSSIGRPQQLKTPVECSRPAGHNAAAGGWRHPLWHRMSITFVYCTRSTIIFQPFNEQVPTSPTRHVYLAAWLAGWPVCLICQVHTIWRKSESSAWSTLWTGVVCVSAGIRIATQMAFNLKAHRQIYALDKIKAST